MSEPINQNADNESRDNKVRMEIFKMLMTLLPVLIAATNANKNIIINACIEGTSPDQPGLMIYQVILNKDIEAIRTLEKIYRQNDMIITAYLKNALVPLPPPPTGKTAEIKKDDAGNIEIKFQ